MARWWVLLASCTKADLWDMHQPPCGPAFMQSKLLSADFAADSVVSQESRLHITSCWGCARASTVLPLVPLIQEKIGRTDFVRSSARYFLFTKIEDTRRKKWMTFLCVRFDYHLNHFVRSPAQHHGISCCAEFTDIDETRQNECRIQIMPGKRWNNVWFTAFNFTELGRGNRMMQSSPTKIGHK